MHRILPTAPARKAAPASDCPKKDIGEKWYVAATKAGREQYARHHLENQQFEVFLPMLRRTVRSGRRLIDRQESCFPGYVFIRFDAALPAWRSVNSTRGVRSLIMSGERPIPLPGGFVEELRASACASGLIRPEHRFQPGDRVRIIAGPFAELVGTLAQMESRGRLGILVELLNGTVPLSIDPCHLVPAA